MTGNTNSPQIILGGVFIFGTVVAYGVLMAKKKRILVADIDSKGVVKCV